MNSDISLEFGRDAIFYFIIMSSNPVMTWGTTFYSPSRYTAVEEVDRILDSQRRYQAMLADEDIFYSRTDLRMFIDQHRNEAKSKLLGFYSQAHNVDVETLPDLVLHAAAWLRVSPLNTRQLIKDYPDLIRHRDGLGSLPLHIAVKAVGDDHADRLEHFLDLYSEATRCIDENGILPLHSALIAGADYKVIQLLLQSYLEASEVMILPRSPVPTELAPFVGMLPFHVACCRSSAEVIYTFLVQNPEYVMGANLEAMVDTEQLSEALGRCTLEQK
jgi:ankyrin repeat protein